MAALLQHTQVSVILLLLVLVAYSPAAYSQQFVAIQGHEQNVLPDANHESESQPGMISNFNQRITGCYFRESSVEPSGGNNSYGVSDIPVELCTHVFYGFAVIDPSASSLQISQPSVAGSFIEKINNGSTVNHTTKAMLSVGGPGELHSSWRNVIENATSRLSFILSIVTTMQQYGFQGVDINFQNPGAADKGNFGLFIEGLKARFSLINATSDGERSYELFVTVNPAPEYRDVAFNASQICKSADFVNLITYDVHDAWYDNRTGYNAPMFAGPRETRPGNVINTTVQAMIEGGCSSRKLVLGIALYGQAWTLPTGSTERINPSNKGVNLPASGPAPSSITGIISRSKICEMVSRDGWTRGVDLASGSYYAYGDNTWLSYDSRRTIGRKISYIMSYGNLGGAFIWSLDQADYRGLCANASGKYSTLSTISLISSEQRMTEFMNSNTHMRRFMTNLRANLSQTQLSTLSRLWLNRNITQLQAHVNITGMTSFQTTD